MKAIIGVLVFIVFMFGLWVKEYKASPPTHYVHLTNFEQTEFNEIIWFWTHDTLAGPVHSNDFIGIKWRPVFYGPVSTCQNRFLEFDPNPYFAIEPVFNAQPYIFPEELPHIIEHANIRFEDHNGRFITHIKLQEDQGIEVHQYRRGMRYQDSLIWQSHPMEHGIIYVDGITEVEGVLVGKLTIYSTKDIWLIDNIRYSGANDMNGRFGYTIQEQQGMQHYLGLVSENDIIIQNNWVNGKENGFVNGPNRIDSHSIIIDAALVTLGGSFTFDQQNDAWDLYQGPIPDERGIIHLTGSIAQYRRGYVHRSNHGTGGGNGTGYGTTYLYDFRFQEGGPPGLAPDEYSRIFNGNFERLSLSYLDAYGITNVNVGSLRIDAGVDVELGGPNTLTIRNELIIAGTEEDPVTIRSDPNGIAGLRTLDQCVVDINYANFVGVTAEFIGERVTINNCTFSELVSSVGATTIDSSKFMREVSIENWETTTISRSFFGNSLDIYGGNADINLTNNTFTGSDRFGVELRRFNTARLVNNIIAFNRDGIINRHWLQPQIEYCNVYGNTHDDFDGCESGEGCISADPLFINGQQKDYRLWSQSPCLDAGDPASPRDPDGSVADMGAYYIDKNVGVETEAGIPAEFMFTAYPNPFNSKVAFSYTLPEPSLVSLSIFDLSGRQIAIMVYEQQSAGSYSLAWEGISQPSGIYMAVVKAGEITETRKLVLMR